MTPVIIIIVPVMAALICAALIIVLHPVLERYALARPNARSSHKLPTPQGGGVAVLAATILAVIIATQISATGNAVSLTLFLSATFIACVGAVDDLRPIPVLPRLILQAGVVAAVFFSLSDSFHLLTIIPLWLERFVLVLAGLWFVNLVNFMDGLDWMTVAEVVPISFALALFGMFGFLPRDPTLIALGLGGAMLGFAPFNRPVAKLFLGDVGSLPIGLLMGWCLLQLAGSGHFVAALILPLYYLADATITLIRRLLYGEAVWIAHRSHFYQRATANGFTVMQIVTYVCVLNLILTVLATATIFYASPFVGITCLITGLVATAFVLNRFSRSSATPSSSGGSPPLT